MLTLIDSTVTIGAAGAVSSSTGNLVGSVTHVSTGVYRFNMKTNPVCNLSAFLGMSASMIATSGGANTVASIEAKSTSPSDMTSGTAPTFTVNLRDYAGALVDPASGQLLTVMIYGRNSSVSQ